MEKVIKLQTFWQNQYTDYRNIILKNKNSELIAVPGCYPTASILGILPLIKYIQPQSKIILDVKSGISGAGRSSVESELEKELKNN